MYPEVPSPSASEPLKGLPPVQPPSGKFLAQLFLVPLLIVSVAVGLIWFLTWLVGGFYTPEKLLRDLHNGNPEVRWRAASDLAQVLKRDDNLAANPAFALELVALLRQELRDNADSERAFAEMVRKQPAAAKQAEPKNLEPSKALRAERDFIHFLIGCLGNLALPAGVPILCEIAGKEDGADPETVGLRRNLAIAALGNVADNRKRFDRLSAEKRAAVLAELDAETESDVLPRRELARIVRDALRDRAAGTPSAMGVDQALDKCADSTELTRRRFSAAALSLWDGTPAENEHIDAILLRLSAGNASAPSDASRAELRGVRYQATLALARRGSLNTKERFAVLHEMLDEDALTKLFRVTVNDRDLPDTAMVGLVLTDALKNLAILHQRAPQLDLSQFSPDVDKLAEHAEMSVRTQAKLTQRVLSGSEGK